ncbi:MAG: hypothetical protein AB1921_18795 [Thermodesulfobacteriota bacterium]
MNIAGVRFRVLAEEATVLAEPGPSYLPFICGEESGAGPDITIRLSFSGGPDTAGMERIFDSGSSWTMYRDGEGWAVELFPRGFPERAFIACANRDFSEVLLYTGGKGEEEGGAHRAESPLSYPLDQILFLHRLAGQNGLLLHASGVLSRGRCLVFPGRSGAGKSTLSGMLAREPGVCLLSDDRVAVRKGGEGFSAHGTPWAGTARMAENGSGMLSAIGFLRKAPENRLVRLSADECAQRLVPVSSIPWYDAQAAGACLDLCRALCLAVPAYDVFFAPGREAARMCLELLEKR